MMSDDLIRFSDFEVDAAERRLTRDGRSLELSGRYLDALLLMARRPGELITKDRFMAEVWRGVPVTDEALTQCIRTLRKVLGDEAGRPRFIETVPKHGYRFIAEVERVEADSSRMQPSDLDKGEPQHRSRPAGMGSDFLLLTAAGLVGGAVAGLVGGITYGLLAATDPPDGTGAISIVLVMTCLCLLVGLLGGLGVGVGVAAGRQLSPGRLFPTMAGGAVGGLVVGSFGRLIGLDAFSLLVGSRPVAITGGSEGVLIGAMAGASVWLALRGPGLPERVALGALLLGAAAGLLVTLGGGQMMAGSLSVLAAAHPQAPLGNLLAALPPWALLASSAIEGATFVTSLTVAFWLALRQASPRA